MTTAITTVCLLSFYFRIQTTTTHTVVSKVHCLTFPAVGASRRSNKQLTCLSKNSFSFKLEGIKGKNKICEWCVYDKESSTVVWHTIVSTVKKSAYELTWFSKREQKKEEEEEYVMMLWRKERLRERGPFEVVVVDQLYCRLLFPFRDTCALLETCPLLRTLVSRSTSAERSRAMPRWSHRSTHQTSAHPTR